MTFLLVCELHHGTVSDPIKCLEMPITLPKKITFHAIM